MQFGLDKINPHFLYSTGAARSGELGVTSFGGGLFLALAAGDGRMCEAETYLGCLLLVLGTLRLVTAWSERILLRGGMLDDQI